MYTIRIDGYVMHNPAMQRESLTALSPKLSLDVNGNGSCSFVIGPGNRCFDLIKRRKSIVTVHQDGREIWRGRVLDDVTDTYKQKTVYAEGVRACLNDSLAAPYTFIGTAQELLSKLITEHNDQVEEDKRFTLGVVTCARASETINGLKNVAYWPTYQEIEEKILNVYGGYLKVRHDGGVLYLDWLQEYGSTNSQQIRFGVNMLDLKDKADSGEMFTVLRPLGASEMGEDGEYAAPVSIASVNNGLDYIQDDEAVAKYGKIWKAYTWGHITDPAELMKKAQEYLKTGAELRTLTIRAIDMHLMDGSIDAIRIGDKVKIHVMPHGIDMEMTCSRMDIDLVQPENTVYTFGEAIKALSDNVIMAEEEIGSLTGGYGGGGGRSVKDDNDGIIRWARITANELEANINLNAGEINTLTGRMNKAEIDIDGLNANILLKASQEEVTALGARLSEAEIEIDGANAEIRLKASQKSVDDLDSRVSSAEIRIDGAESTIELKADKTYVDNLIAQSIAAAFANISLTDIDTIVADNLNVMDYANFQCSLNVNGDINMSNHDVIASGINAQSFTYKGNLLSINEHSLMTGGKVTEGSTYANYPVYKDGVQIGSVNIPSTWKFTPTYGTKVKYLGVNGSED